MNICWKKSVYVRIVQSSKRVEIYVEFVCIDTFLENLYNLFKFHINLKSFSMPC